LLGAEQPKGLAVLEAQGKTGLQTDQQAEFATDLQLTCNILQVKQDEKSQ